MRCFFNSLTMKIKQYQNYMAEYVEPADEIVVLNGGSLHTTLMQMIADKCQVPVKGGVRYATLLGNVMNQLLAKGEVANVEEMRELAKRSFGFREYEPASK